MSIEQTERVTFLVRGADGLPIRGTVFTPESSDTRSPVVVICHGFKAFQNWGFFPSLGEYFAKLGYYAITFEFSHNGVGEDPFVTSDLDLFKQNRFAFERADVRAVIAAVQSQQLPSAERADGSRIFVVGHSRGGAAAISAGALPGVLGLALLASIAEYPAVTKEEAEKWARDGVWFVENTRTKQQLPLGLALLRELQQERGTIERSAKALDLPVCIIHGTGDTTVAPTAAESLAEWIKSSDLHLLDTDHTFGVRHPYEQRSEAFENVERLVADFFARCLSASAS